MNRMVGEGLTAEPCDTAIKGWSVSTRKPLQKGVVIGGAAPLLMHQTLANRERVLVCASCHRFVGNPATQLAMLEGLSRSTPSRAATNALITKKRRRCEDASGLGPASPPAADAASSRRIAVACTPTSRLPDLPAATKEAHASEENGEEKEEKEGAGGIWRCNGGAPCDHVYCSTRCRQAALLRGHGLICLGGSGPGSPLFEFHRYAASTSETYLIAAAAVATALSSTPRTPSSAGGNGVDRDEGTRPFEALDGWDEPYLQASHGNDGNGNEGAGGRCVGGRRKGRTTVTSAVKGIGVSIEEAEEAWSMLTAGLLYGRNAGRNGTNGEGWDRDDRALSLDFFLRLVRALGRHLAPISVPSPLVSYCARLVQASPETKARALPWLASAIERAGPFGGADGGGGEGGVVEGPEGPNPTVEGGELVVEGGRSGSEVPAEESDPVILGERGLCRLVQASGAAAAGTATSCVPNAQLEAFLLPATVVPSAGDGNKRLSVGSGGDDSIADREKPGSRDFSERSDLGTALRVGLVTLRGVRAGEELFAPYVALGQSVEDRRRELSSRFSPGRAAATRGTGGMATSPSSPSSLPLQQQEELPCGCPRCMYEAEGDARSCGREMLKILADQALEEGRHGTALRLYRASLATATSAPDSGTLALAGNSGAPTCARKEDNGGDSPSVAGAAAAAAAAAAATGRGGGRNVPPGAGDRDARAQAGALVAADEGEEAAVGDALHGVGVALLAAGRFREACRAWESGFREAPHHPTLRAQAEKEAAYRPSGKGEAIGANGPKEGGEEREKEESREGSPPADNKQVEPTTALSSATGGSPGAVGGGDRGCTHHSFASTPGGAADIFLSRTAVLSSEECRAVIQAAEEYSQANGGWTTSRHYAVPTTDLPIHVLKPVLPWFRSLVSGRLFPALAQQFSLAGGARSVSIHDAFVVRYEEGKQRHLPLHRDQSTHSFTIALNGLEQYSGGGTFFPCLGRSLRPAEGHTLSFREDILHGGDPLLEGVRYIIACFCYYDDCDYSDADGEGGGGGGRGGAALDGGGRRGCRKSAEERRARGHSSSGGGGSDVNGSSSSTGSAAEGNGGAGSGKNDAGEGGRGIEFSSDEAFSFEFGFG